MYSTAVLYRRRLVGVEVLKVALHKWYNACDYSGYASNSVGRINLYCRALSTSWPSTRDSAQTSSMRHTSNAVIATLIFGISIPLIAHSLSVMLKFRPVGRPPAPTSSVAACHKCYLIWLCLQHRHLLLEEGSITSCATLSCYLIAREDASVN